MSPGTFHGQVSRTIFVGTRYSLGFSFHAVLQLGRPGQLVAPPDTKFDLSTWGSGCIPSTTYPSA